MTANLFKTHTMVFGLLAASFCSVAQVPSPTYAAKWATIDSLIDRSKLPESALTQVNAVYARAKAEKNDVQVIKALIYQMRLQESKQEDATIASISLLDKELVDATQPAKAILESIQAENYWNYLQRNRYKLYNRTTTTGYAQKDISTWSSSDLHKKIGSLYLSSIQDEKMLQNNQLAEYDPILAKGNTRNLRPTLYDLLAHRALEYFKTDERDLSKPSDIFEIDDPIAFAGATQFISHRFSTIDSADLHAKALTLFQRIIRFHLSDTDPSALIDLDIERITFINSFAVMPDKDSLNEKALSVIANRYGDLPTGAQAWYLLAQEYANKARQYDPFRDTVNRYDYIKAENICKKVLTQSENSEGRTNCQNLLQEIRQRSVTLNTEKVNIPGQPFRTLITWRNFTTIHMRIIRLDQSPKNIRDQNTYDLSYWKKLLLLPSLRTFSQALPETGDHQQHKAEIKIDGLPAGAYAILASADSSFGLNNNNQLTVQYTYVSSIAYVHNDRDYFVVDRDNGQPLPGAAIQVWDQVYDYTTRKNILTRSETYQTDQHGHFLMRMQNNKKRNRSSQLLEITTGTDHLFLEETVNAYYSGNDVESSDILDQREYEKNNLQAFLFTDRAIYRPGQTIYFKGIVITRNYDSHRPAIVTRFPTKILLYDVNGTRIDSLIVQSNDFGSYKGKFTLPQNLLNGECRITDDSAGDSRSFSVEEYKRPKFLVEYEVDKGAHKIGDSIHLTGVAKAYAGNNIDGATVKYRVVRQARYPWYFGKGNRYMPNRGQEIAHGETRTDAQGRFHIIFKAIPDRSVAETDNPVFDYTVSADVTDINGETRSGETVAKAAYTTLQLTVTAPIDNHLPSDSLKKLVVQATDLAGTPQSVLVKLSIYSLRSPQRLIRARYWEQPDQFVMSREAYLRDFPQDDFNDDGNSEKWERDQKLTISDSSGRPINVQTPTGNTLPAGWYLVEARATDRSGKEVKALRYIELYNGKTGRPATPSYNWPIADDGRPEPGMTASIQTGTSATGVFVIRKLARPAFSIFKDSMISSVTFFSLDNNNQITQIPVTEADRGGFSISDIFIKDNRVYTNDHSINVPWTNKELDVNYATWRDKTLPGSDEKWQVQITGHHTDQITAEVLAGMYDASLDQFKLHSWEKPYLYPEFGGAGSWDSEIGFGNLTSRSWYDNSSGAASFDKEYDALIVPEILLAPSRGLSRGRVMPMAASPGASSLMRKKALGNGEMQDLRFDSDGSKGLMRNAVTDSGEMFAHAEIMPKTAPSAASDIPVQIRKNFNETAFFFPNLRTDSSGNLTLSFTMPEALTKWKMMMLAHTRDLSFGYSEKTVITQKQLMVQPNMPRFLREGDRMELSVKVVNMTDSELTGQMELQLTDPTTGQTADGQYTNRQPNQYFTVGEGQSAVVNFPIDVPFQYNRPVQYRVTAKAHNYSDGEEAIIPVVSNRMLVTESLPLNLQGDGTRTFKFDKLLQSGSSETLNHHALTVEFTGNPAWYAVQALPYLMEYPYECAEQTFNRFYANALASTIVKSSPRIREIFVRWRTTDTAALLSNLKKNPELRSVLLQETPWVLKGKSESEQKKNIALLFDMTKMAEQLSSTIAKLAAMQSSNGGFAWFKGGPDDRYITQYIMTGIGHLQFLQAIPESSASTIHAMIRTAIPYLDKLAKEDYEKVRRSTAKVQPIGPVTIQYLYMRSMFSNPGIPGDVFPAVNYFRKQAQQSWQQEGILSQAMTALALYRTGDKQTAVRIMASLKETGIKDPEKGMYYKGMERAYYWYQSPIETQSMVIEAFHTISPDATVERDLKTWLLTNKQTHSWSTTRATADACYALLLDGAEWLTSERSVDIRLGDKTASTGNDGATEAGTGYFKKVFNGPFVNPSMGNITVTMTTKATPGAAATQPRSTPQAKGSPTDKPGTAGSSMPAWGAVYWQYFDNLDRITASGNGKAPLKLVKKLFVTTNTDRGPVLQLLAENGVLHPGDKVTVRIELQSDRDLEYVHMKDMRGACMEPVNVLSEYKWQGGLGYYESTRDVSTDFFFSRMPRGSYVFEYPVFVGQTGNFSNGVTSIECMYAPEFSFHSEGIRVNVE